MSYIRNRAIEGLKTGDMFSVSRTFTEQDMFQFAKISRDYNPVHLNEQFAQVKRFSGRVCHGLLIASLVTEIGGQIGWLASGMKFKFIKPVYFKDTITCDFTVTNIDCERRARARAVFYNQHNFTVLEAILTGILPGKVEKDIMSAMDAEGGPDQ